MMKFAIFLFAVLQCVVLGMGALARYPVSTHPDYPEKCWFQEDNKAYAVDENWSKPGSCGRFTCNDDFSVVYATCGAVAPGPGYTVSKTDVSKPYPECCPKLIKQ